MVKQFGIEIMRNVNIVPLLTPMAITHCGAEVRPAPEVGWAGALVQYPVIMREGGHHHPHHHCHHDGHPQEPRGGCQGGSLSGMPRC